MKHLKNMQQICNIRLYCNTSSVVLNCIAEENIAIYCNTNILLHPYVLYGKSVYTILSLRYTHAVTEGELPDSMSEVLTIIP